MGRIRADDQKKHNNANVIQGVLANPLRLQILAALGYGKLSLNELVDMLKLDLNSVRRELAALLSAHLVRKSFAGGKSAYAIANRKYKDVWSILYQLWVEEISRPAHRPSLTL